MEYQITIIIKISMAFLVGLAIGIDRERNNKAAGMRTQMLICVASALLSAISVHLSDFLGITNPALRGDPARLMAQIVSGIGFVGGGVILKSKERVTGVTTAATIWTTAAIGIAIGIGLYLAAGVTTLMVLLLDPLAQLQHKYGLKTYPYILLIRTKDSSVAYQLLNNLGISYRVTDKENQSTQLLIQSSDILNKNIKKVFDSKNISCQITESEE
jgi:putative Mg2+ transporter-C (MgtC) family protein